MTVGTMLEHPVTIHLWDLERKDPEKGRPYLHATVRVNNGPNRHPLSAFAVSAEYNILGLGFADGAVIVVRGDILHDRGSRQRVVYNATVAITGLEFYEDRDKGTALLYVASLNQILTVSTTGKNSGKPEKVLDKSKGATLGCVTREPGKPDGQLVVVRDNEICYYSHRRKGVSYELDVPKRSVLAYKHYLVITTTLSTGTVVSTQTTRLLVFDTLNKVIAFSSSVGVGVREILVEWGEIVVIGTDGIMHMIKEKDLDTRLRIVKERELYDVALEMARNLKVDEKKITQIEREYGDYLYSKGEVGDAMVHFINAVDLGDTSEIILKYRDSQHMENLTSYLEALHRKGVASTEHTTLLLNAYSKLKYVDKLTAFIEGSSAESYSFDYDAAIRICRQAGYATLAVYLAQKTGDCDLAVQIMLQDLHDYKGCLQYVKSLIVSDALRILVENSRTLLDNLPMDTTALLIVLFTGKFIPAPVNLALPAESDLNATNGKFYTPELSTLTTPVIQSYKAFLSYIGGLGTSSNVEESTAEVLTGATEIPEPTYQPPRPRLIFSSFVDHSNEFVVFLEACIEAYDSFEANEKDRIDLLTTLFEMYLNLAHSSTDEDRKRYWQSKARDLASENKNMVDKTSMLLTSHLLNFDEGELLAQENEENFHVDLFRACVATKDTKRAIEILHKYGDKDQELFPLALLYFTSSVEILQEVGSEFDYVLKGIRETRVLSPLEVIQILSKNSVTTMGHVRDYLLDLIKTETAEIERNKGLSGSYRKDANELRDRTHKVLHDPAVVQYSECASCGLTLDLPVVHFACKHSYHHRCLSSGVVSEVDGEELRCPRCMPELEGLRAMRLKQEADAERTELFTSALKESDNKFKVISDFIGRGVLTTS